jgi:hypothetical protein
MMRKYFTTALLIGALSTVPAIAGAATSPRAGRPAAAKREASAVATHATRGIVKSVDASTLVITRTSKKHGEMTFTMNPATHRRGDIAVGAPVSVRYRRDGKNFVATAVRVQPKQHAAHASSSK